MGRIRDGARRLAKLHGSPRGIAGGFALGLGLSLVPIPVAGMLTALALAPILRCNLPATYLGSAIVNPVTGPFIYFTELWLGLWVAGMPLPSWPQLRGLDVTGWWALLQQMAGPFLIGATLLVTAATAVSFAVLLPLSRQWQRRRGHAPADDREGNHDEGDARARTSPPR